MDNKLLIKKIKENKKYKSLSEEIISEEIKKYNLSNPSIKEIDKIVVKEIRTILHKTYSSFQTGKKKKRKLYLEELKKDMKNENIDEEIISKLLSITVSTKERIKDYKKLYSELFKITGNPKTIVDLGCGLNPLSFLLIDFPINYYAYDIDVEDMKFLNDFFKIVRERGINGKAKILDVRKTEQIKKLPCSDVVFLFKLIDVIDKSGKGHKNIEELIKTLVEKTNFIVASFATKTITRKKMNFPQRKWFELMLNRIGLKFKTIETSNEIFYVVQKQVINL